MKFEGIFVKIEILVTEIAGFFSLINNETPKICNFNNSYKILVNMFVQMMQMI